MEREPQSEANDTRGMIERYLPTIERARAAGVSLRTRLWHKPGSAVDLLAVEPVEQRRLAAVTLDARALGRTMWEKNVELSEERFAAFPTGIPPEPARMVAASHHVLVAARGEGPAACSMCPARPGREICARCNGGGKIHLDHDYREVEPCPSCGGAAFVRCSVCEGSARTRRARVRFVEDRVDTLRYTYVPSMTIALESALDEALAPGETGALPDCLRFDPRPRATGGPYRGGPAAEPTFHGHRFGDALRRATSAAAGLGGEGQILRQEIATYARPILWLRYKIRGARREVVLSARASGEPFAFVAPR
ncbi:hypothetical protein [Sorangium sp. So ce131]|uniref:hypothetical protein n=1 Tax=Sorangium sp. So ce131 TaxID=3133282 RepID=UPI003F61C5E9